MKYTLFYLILLSFASVSCTHSQENDTENNTTLHYTKLTVPYKQIQGTDPDLLSLDLYYDPNRLSPKPVIIWVHGGGWSIGDKNYQISHKIDFFAQMGYLFVSVNYRLSPYPYEVNNPNRLKFPVHITDVADAVAWVHRHIRDYGGDPDQIVLMGHSAGAQLVALAGSYHVFLQQAGVPVTAVKAVIPVDTRMYDVYNIIQNYPPLDLYLNAFGDDPQQNIEASANRHLNSTDYFPRFLIIKRGTPERMAHAEMFVDSLRQNQIEVQQLETNPYSHSEVNEAIGMPDEQIVTPGIQSFLKNLFQ